MEGSLAYSAPVYAIIKALPFPVLPVLPACVVQPRFQIKSYFKEKTKAEKKLKEKGKKIVVAVLELSAK